MELHESLSQLARDHGESLFAEADAFRGALDDYLDEGSASTGTINLLTDAVRLGALQGMLSMLDSGASVDDAVETAGQRLSRDRGSADVAGSQWACAVLGYALGRVPVSLAARLRPDAYTAEPPASPPAPPSAPSPPPTQQSPAQQWPAQQPPAQQSPPQQWQSPGGPAASHQPASHQHAPQAPGQYGGQASPYAFTATPGYGAPAPKKSRAGLLVGAIVAVVVLGVVAVIGIIALSGGDDDPSADDDTSETTGETSGATSETASETSDTVTTDPALTFRGGGYQYQFPNSDWRDLTAETDDTAGTIDSITAPADSIARARGNILVESASARGETDVYNAVDDWKAVLERSTGAAPRDIGTMEIDGKTAIGVDLEWTNANNFDVQQIAYLVISGDETYSITASFEQGDSTFRDIFYDVLETWVWEE